MKSASSLLHGARSKIRSRTQSKELEWIDLPGSGHRAPKKSGVIPSDSKIKINYVWYIMIKINDF